MQSSYETRNRNCCHQPLLLVSVLDSTDRFPTLVHTLSLYLAYHVTSLDLLARRRLSMRVVENSSPITLWRFQKALVL